MIETSAEEVRRTCQGLRPTLLDDIGLKPALEDLVRETGELNGFDVKTELSSFSMERLRESAAAFKDVPLPQTLKGAVNVALSLMTAGPTGLMSLREVRNSLAGR